MDKTDIFTPAAHVRRSSNAYNSRLFVALAMKPMITVHSQLLYLAVRAQGVNPRSTDLILIESLGLLG